MSRFVERGKGQIASYLSQNLANACLQECSSPFIAEGGYINPPLEESDIHRLNAGEEIERNFVVWNDDREVTFRIAASIADRRWQIRRR